MYPLTVAMVIGTKQLADEVRPVLQTLGCRVVLDENDIGDWVEFVGNLERLRPTVMLFDVSRSQASMEDQLRRIRAAHNPPVIFAIDTTATPEKVLRAIHAGAVEFIYPPITAPLAEALTRVGEETKRRIDSQGHGRVVVFVSAKGGCGATTVAAHTALEKMIGIPVLVTVPSDYQALYECYSEGKFLSSNHPLSRRFAEVAAHVTGMPVRKKHFSLLA